MKKFVLSEILLLSTVEKKAKKVKFNPKRTLIYGGNGTGKSCLIKSIYKTFGAAPVKDHPNWKQVNPISFVRFSIEGVNYSILKDGKYYAVFDMEDELIGSFQHVTTELAPFLADLFDFKIKLPNQKNELITPPPAFLFLPYYIDQDVSWQSNWSSFDKLGQIKSYREPIASYHTGLKPNDYYTTKGEIEQLKNNIKELDDESRVLKNILEKVKKKITQADFNIDIESFKEEVKELLVECETLKNQQEKLKSRLVEYYNLKITLESQITIAKKALNETRLDYNYAKELLVEDSVDCPTCGAHYENTFIERFEIAKDEDRCKELLVDLTRELKEIEDKITKTNSEYSIHNEEIARIESILAIKKGEIKLRDVIENAGRNEIKSIFSEDSKSIQLSIQENALKQKDLEYKLKSIMDKQKREQIMNLYYKLMKRYLLALDVKGLREESYKKIESRIPETGSALPRALIAYYFSIFSIMKQYTTSVYCPIVIDSPNQQAQDLGHVDKILKFINENQPDDTQLILGIEELYNVNFNCEIVELKDKLGLLQKEEYESVSDELDIYQSKLWNSQRGLRLF